MTGRRRLNRKYPAPPPTPPGKVWATKAWRGTVLVRAEELQAACRASMGMLDDLPENVRLQVYETGIIPENLEMKIRENAKTAPLGFARAM